MRKGPATVAGPDLNGSDIEVHTGVDRRRGFGAPRRPLLTDEQVVGLRQRRLAGQSAGVLAADAGVSTQTVWRALRGQVPYDRPLPVPPVPEVPPEQRRAPGRRRAPDAAEAASAARPARLRQAEIPASRRGRHLRRDAREHRRALLAALREQLARGETLSPSAAAAACGLGVNTFYRNWNTLSDALAEVREDLQHRALEAVLAAADLARALDAVLELQRLARAAAPLVRPTPADPVVLARHEAALEPLLVEHCQSAAGARPGDDAAPDVRALSVALWAHAAALATPPTRGLTARQAAEVVLAWAVAGAGLSLRRRARRVRDDQSDDQSR